MGDKPARTKKPCEGCGKPPATYHTRLAGEVCEDCKRLMADGLKYRAAFAETGRDLAWLPWARHCWKYIHHGYVRHNDNPTERFQQAILDLAKAIAPILEPEDADLEDRDGIPTLCPRNDSHGAADTLAAFPKGVPALVDLIYRSVLEIADNAYQNGLSEGHGLILGLASGRTTIDKFNKATIGRDDEE